MKQLTEYQLKEILRRDREEIADNGFSQRVVSRLPSRLNYPNYEWIVWLCSGVGLLLLFFLKTTVPLLKLLLLVATKLTALFIGLVGQITPERATLGSLYLGVIMCMCVLVTLMLPKIKEQIGLH